MENIINFVYLFINNIYHMKYLKLFENNNKWDKYVLEYEEEINFNC